MRGNAPDPAGPSQEYLAGLDTQQDVIARGDAEALLSRLALEEAK